MRAGSLDYDECSDDEEPNRWSREGTRQSRKVSTMERPLSLQPTQGQPFLILNLSGTPRRGLQTPAAMRVEVPLAPGTSSLLLLSYLAAWHIDAVPFDVAPDDLPLAFHHRPLAMQEVGDGHALACGDVRDRLSGTNGDRAGDEVQAGVGRCKP